MARAAANQLVTTDIPGVYRNRAGVQVNEAGVAMSFASVKAADDARWVEAVGSAPTSPAALLKAAALNPRLPLDVRLGAARQAAPYFDMRMPLRIDGTMTSTSAVDPAKLAAMPREDRELLLKLLKSAGVTL